MNTDREILLDGNLNKKTSKFCCHKEKPKPVPKKEKTSRSIVKYNKNPFLLSFPMIFFYFFSSWKLSLSSF